MTAAPELDGLAARVVDIVERFGEIGAAVAVAAENLFPPIPSEVVLPLTGFSASLGEISLVGAIVWTTVGSLVGATTLYALGALLGEARLRRLAERLPLLEPSDIDRAHAWFERHGRPAVFFGRLIPVVRSLISIPAGVHRMPIPTFLAFTLLGSALWNAALVLAGYQLGERWHVLEPYLGTLSRAVLVLGVLAVTVWILRRRRRRSPRLGAPR